MKKFLSLVLALVMTMSLVTVSAGAKDFGDSADLSGEAYEEAVNVMSEMGIIDGYSDGDFRPQGTLTRQAAAKIIACMMLGKTTAESLGTSAAPFKDVPAGSSFAGYIAFCVERGLISGYADGTFRPTGTLTGFAFLKMLLGALGYDQSIEGYTGTNWTVNVAGRAYEIGLTDGNDNFVGSKACTREEAALYAVNTLKATLVEYANKGSSITINGIEVVQGASEPTYVTSTVYNQATSINADRDNSGDYTVEFAERYQTDLRLEAETDVFQRPARVWSWKGEEIGTYVDYSKMVAEYTTSVTGKELYDVVGKTAFDKYDFSSYVDGKVSGLYKEIDRNNKSDVSNTENGALTQAFVDVDDETVVVTVVNTYLAQATADYNEKKETVNFQIYDMTGEKGTVSSEDFAIEDIEKDDFVLVTYADDAIQSIDDVEILSNVEISKFSASNSEVSAVTVDGTKYDASAKLDYDEKVLDDYTDNNLKDTTYNVYLDSYGYVIGVDIVDKVDNYVFIAGVDKTSSNLTTKNYEANAIFMDGTSGVIDVKNNDDINKAITTDPDNGPVINKWFKYTVNSSNVYTLTAIPYELDDDDPDVAQSWTAKNQVGEINSKNISLYSSNDGRIYGNDDSVYMLAELDKVTKSGDSSTFAVIKEADEVIIGVDNVSFTVWGYTDAKEETDVTPVTNNTNMSYGTYALYDEDNYVIAAVVVGTSDGVSQTIAYVHTDDLEDEGYDRSTGMWTWTRNVIINGEEVLLTETNDDDDESLLEDLTKGGWYTIKYDADGNVKGTDKLNSEDDEEYVTTLVDAVKKLRTEDLVIVDIAKNIRLAYSTSGRTLWNSENSRDNGIRVDSDVKVVVTQTNDRKTTTDYYVGYDALVAALEELNEKSDTNKYYFGAVIEEGRATSIIIEDGYSDDDVTGPSGSTGDIAVLSLTFDSASKKFSVSAAGDDVALPAGELTMTVKMNGFTVATRTINDFGGRNADEVFAVSSEPAEGVVQASGEFTVTLSLKDSNGDRYIGTYTTTIGR